MELTEFEREACYKVAESAVLYLNFNTGVLVDIDEVAIRLQQALQAAKPEEE